MMEELKMEKRVMSEELDVKLFEPVLVKIDKSGCAPHDIHIDKNEFKIGRARENDEIILDTMISRKQCILRCEGNEEWTIKDLSSSCTFINHVPLTTGVSKRLYDGDIVQFSTSEEFKYVFTLITKDKHKIKRQKLNEKIFENILIEQKTVEESQECQKRVLKSKLKTQQKEQDELKQQLTQLLKQQTVTKEDTENLKTEITVLEDKIKRGNEQEQHLFEMYIELLKKLENERVQVENRLNDEKQKWQEALNVSKQEKEMLENKMKEQMEKWREEQQAEWKNIMEMRVKEEKTIQTQLLNEKTVLEEKLKEMEKALRDQEVKRETKEDATPGHSNDNYISLGNLNCRSEVHILDTIDLTTSQLDTDTNEKEAIINKVGYIMDEQLTCSICSDLFVTATTLNCMHTFCQHCINSWIKKKKECPVCRTAVSSMNRSIVLDNFIDSMLDTLPSSFKERRKNTIEERRAVEHKKKSHKKHAVQKYKF